MKMGFIKDDKNSINKQLEIPADFKHVLILGETGSGKTASVITPLLLDRMKKNHGILIFDFKGNYHYTVKALAKKEGRLKDVIELGKIYGTYSNIIENLPLEALDKIFRSLIKHGKNNKFWEESAIQLGLSILGILKYINELTDNYQYSYSFYSLIEIASSANNIKSFKESVLNTVYYLYNHLEENSLKLNIIPLIMENYKKLDAIADEVSLNSMIENNENTTFNSIIASLISPIASLRKKNINVKEINILEELNKGKIIVVSLNDFEENMLNAIVASIFYQIYYFKMDYSDSKISVFMDEAQKVLNDDFELPLDVLREFKVEAVLATQSIANLKEKVDSDKIEALLANFVHKIYLNGQDMQVSEYEAVYNSEYYTLNSVEFNNKEKFEAEIEYQKNYSKLKNFSFVYENKPVIYSRFSDTKLSIKDEDFKVIGKTDFFLRPVTKEELRKKYSHLLKISNLKEYKKALEMGL
jgi:DNA helicase HerA-like ATPase